MAKRFNGSRHGPMPTFVPSGILIHPAVWPRQTWAENWGLCPFSEEGSWVPSNTMWPGPRPTCTPSFIFIHPIVWPQYTNVTDRTVQETDNGLMAYRANRFTNGRPKTTSFLNQFLPPPPTCIFTYFDIKP